VWAPDGSAIVVRRNVPAPDSAGTFELLLLGRDGSRAVLASRDGTALFPVGFSPDGGTLYFATLDATGSDLHSVDASGGGETAIAHLSDEIARDWKLSPDGGKIAFTVAEAGDPPRVATLVVDLADGAIGEPLPASDAVQLNPAWSDDGELAVASIDPMSGEGEAIAVEADGATETITEPAEGVDLPLSYAPDGASLAVRAVEDAASPDSASYVEVVTCGEDAADCDERERISDSADVLIVGWLE
jgi:hypothetical protein